MSRIRDALRVEERRLLETLALLDEVQRIALLEFAAFLAARAQRPAAAPVLTLRPASETVVQAIKRLNASYPVLERRRLLQPVGALVSEHMLGARPARETIDALEALYAARYEATRLQV